MARVRIVSTADLSPADRGRIRNLWRGGYVEAVAVHPERQRRGLGSRVMGGARWAMSPSGLVRTADDDDSTLVRLVPGAPALDVSGTLACDWREGDLW